MYSELALTHNAAKFTYLALGDSYTIGESVALPDRWTYLLTHYLRQAGINLEDPVTIAQTGWTTAELLQAIQESNLTALFDLVTLLIGVNNQYRGQSVATYQVELRELLQIALRFAANKPERIIVLSIPDWGVTPFATDRDQAKITREIDAFNAVAKIECTAAKITFIDITPASRLAQQDNTYLAPDHLHYSGEMYAMWAALALPAAKSIFNQINH